MRQRSAWVRKAKKSGVQEFPLKYKWEFRTNSFEKVFATLFGAIEDTGYRVKRNSVDPKPQSLPDNADFSAGITGYKRLTYIKGRRTLTSILAILIAVALFSVSIPGDIGVADTVVIVIGIIISVLGGISLDASIIRYKLFLNANLDSKVSDSIDGEYNTGMNNNNAFLTINCDAVGRRIRWSQESAEHRTVKEDFSELQKRVDSVIRSI